MANETSFLNECLSTIGADRITAIDDGTINANKCLDIYPNLRRAALRVHTWDFADEDVQLQLNTTSPLIGYMYSYALPADYVRLIQYYGSLPTSPGSEFIGTFDPTSQNLVPYKIKGPNLYSNDSTVYIAYIKDVDNPNLWDALFYQMMVSWMASKLANAITKDPKRADSLLGQAINFGLPMAAAVESQESPVAPFVVDDLTWGR